MSAILTSLHGKLIGLDKDGRLNCPGGFVSGPHQLSGDMEAGTGITTGTGTIYRSGVIRVGDIIHTQILIDLTGLDSNVVTDIIGVAGGTANCHLGQITTARNGTIIGGRMNCLEAPTTGEPDLDLWAADEATGAEDTAITALTNDTNILESGADWTDDMSQSLTGVPATDQYLYLVGGGGTTDDTYDAGIFLIELVGYAA